MRLLGTLAALWLGLVAMAPVHAATAAHAILVQAGAALASGQYPEARVLAGTGLSDPLLEELTRSRLLVVRGLAQQALGQADDALIDFTVALQGNALQEDERARALFARGLVLDGQGRLEAAIGDYSAALRISPLATYALNNRANVYRRQNRFVEARRDYMTALDANTPNPQYPWYGLGQIAEAEGDSQMARRLYNKALAADAGFQLARERIQALGASLEEPGALSANTGIIVLRPPPAKEQPIQLRPPPPSGERTKPPNDSSSDVLTRVADPRQRRPAPTPTPPPGQGAPLRPAITEGVSVAGPVVQLGAWRSEAEARDGWALARAGAGGLLDGLQPTVVTVTLPERGTFYRLRVRSRGPAVQFCSLLTAKGLACLPVRN